MSRQKILELFDQIVEAYEEMETALAALEEFEPEPPSLPRQVENVGVWFEYIEAEKKYNRQKDHIGRIYRLTTARLYQLKESFLRLELPAAVWFRHGDQGIGLLYSKADGYVLKVSSWQEEMPSLYRE